MSDEYPLRECAMDSAIDHQQLKQSSAYDLLPPACRTLYESLLRERSRPFTADAAADPLVESLRERGLVDAVID